MDFGEILKNRRMFGKFSLEKLSSLSGYSVSTLMELEKNTIKPVIYDDIQKETLKDNNIGLFNDYLKFYRLTKALRFDVEELEDEIKKSALSN